MPAAVDVRQGVDLRTPDGRQAADLRSREVTEVRSQQSDLAADRWQTPGDAAEVGAASGLELVSWVHSLGGTPVRVLKQDQIVYLADWDNVLLAAPGTGARDGSIQAYGVTDPLVPKLMSTVFTPEHEMHDMVIDGRWLYAANDLLGLRLVDISRPDSLRSVTNRVRDSSPSSRLYANSVAVTTRGTGEARRTYALVGYLYGGGLDIHVVADGGPIQDPIHYTTTALVSRYDVHHIQIRGDLAYLLTSDGESQMALEILDLSPLPALPILLGRHALAQRDFGGIGDIRLSGDMLYLAASTYNLAPTDSGRLHVISVADASHPVMVRGLNFSPGGNVKWRGLGLTLGEGQEAYVMTSAGVQVIDVNVRARGLAPYPSEFGVCQGGTAVLDGDLLYVGAHCEQPNGHGGLAIYRRR